MFSTQQWQHNIPFIHTELVGWPVIVHHIDIRFIVSGGVGAGRWYITGGSILGSRPYFHIQIGGFSPNLVTIKSHHVYMYYTHSFASPSIYGCPWSQKAVTDIHIYYSIQVYNLYISLQNFKIKEEYKNHYYSFNNKHQEKKNIFLLYRIYI